MSAILEKIVSSLLGGLVGSVIGLFIIRSPLPTLSLSSESAEVLFFILLGVLCANLIREVKIESKMQRNHKVRNETVALITHEMKTGLTSTGWAIQLILQEYGSIIKPADKKMLEDITKSIRGTVMHSVNLLDVSLLDVGKLIISLDVLTLDQVEEAMKETVEKYSYGAQQKSIAFTNEIKLDPTKKAEVDMIRLRVIVENLLENAIQYTADIVGRKKEIRLSISNTDKELKISLSDTGIGIPLAERYKMFNEFYRATNARKKLISGSGIGLFMCSEYVKAHRGKIGFESKENEGTTFFVSIPLKTVVDTNEFLEKI